MRVGGDELLVGLDPSACIGRGSVGAYVFRVGTLGYLRLHWIENRLLAACETQEMVLISCQVARRSLIALRLIVSGMFLLNIRL